MGARITPKGENSHAGFFAGLSLKGKEFDDESRGCGEAIASISCGSLQRGANQHPNEFCSIAHFTFAVDLTSL